MTTPDVVLCTTDQNGVATLTLNRPEKGNAYNQAMLDALEVVLARLNDDTAVRAVVLRGTGKHFCVGGDILGDPKPHTGEAGQRTMLPALCHALDHLPKPTVAFIHGACFGGGFAFAACCDVVLAERQSFFCVPELRLGFSAGPITPYFLQALGPRHLRRYLLSGERFTAEQAMRMDFVHEIYEGETGEAMLAELLDNILLSAPSAVAEAKAHLHQSRWTPPTPELLAELQIEFRKGYESADGVEGRASFRDKRRPAWAPKI
jgi:methylglutaconyl-CoA hydratase